MAARSSTGPVHAHAPRRARVTTVAGLLASLVLLGACSDQAISPASLEELPPRGTPAPAPTSTATATPSSTPEKPRATAREYPLSCGMLHVDLPEAWSPKGQPDGSWTISLPDDTGGGGVRVTGSFLPADAPLRQDDLEGMVRGSDGDDARVQVNATTHVVLGRVAVRRGMEFRFAKAFSDVGAQLATLTYSPAGDASDAEVDATLELLQSAASKADLDHTDGCT